ncbi:MAG: ribosome recycling factor [Sedimentisphaerales bacterium]|nr:ribosome recycling factor [Sedimentisphaerales bacterium]
MPIKKLIDTHRQNMQKAMDHLQGELRSVRTGRASTGLVENLRVEYYGTPTPLNQLATLAAPDATMILIKPFDPAALKDIEKAIKTSDLSLAPILDGKVIRLNIPPLSEERRTQIVSQIKQMGEQTKVSIRNIRRDANKDLDDEEKKKLISEDERDKGKKDMDNITKDFTNNVEDMIKAKSKEIMEN